MRSSTCGRCALPKRLRHQQCNAQHELGFGEVLGRALMRRMCRGVGDVGGAVQHVDIAEQEDPFPGHQYIIEKDRAVHLLETRAERVVEMRPAEIEALAAQEFEPRRAAWDRKAQRERAVALGVPAHARRIDPDLVGQRPQSRQDPRAAHDNAGIGLAHDLQRRPLLQVEHARDGAAALQIDQRMGQSQIVLAYVLVIAQHVLAPFGAALREEFVRRRPRRHK